MTAGSGESQSATPYGRALWDADKKSALFAEVVKSTEIAKMAWSGADRGERARQR